jgi:hypothetical protein
MARLARLVIPGYPHHVTRTKHFGRVVSVQQWWAKSASQRRCHTCRSIRCARIIAPLSAAR